MQSLQRQQPGCALHIQLRLGSAQQALSSTHGCVTQKNVLPGLAQTCDYNDSAGLGPQKAGPGSMPGLLPALADDPLQE